MPSAPRNERRKRRILTRALQSESLARAKTTVVLHAVLGKLGGEIELSKADLDAAALKLRTLSFVIEPSAVEGNFMVRLVSQTEPATPAAPVVPVPVSEQSVAAPQESV